jgi:hypothetical protein
VLVVAVRSEGEEHFMYNPREDYRLSSGCVLVVLGEMTDLKSLRPRFAAT